jgi:hypothetical protein
MKIGKIISLVISVAFITTVFTIIGMVFFKNETISEDFKKEEIQKSKKEINNWTSLNLTNNSEYFLELLDVEENELIPRLKEVVFEINMKEEELLNSKWCETKTLTYNIDCEEQKKEMRSFLGTFKKMAELLLEAEYEPENPEPLEKFEKSMENFEKTGFEYIEKYQKFLDKKYY